MKYFINIQAFVLFLITFSSCTAGMDENKEIADCKSNVKVEINLASRTSRSQEYLGSPGYSVDRILLLPFKKTDESLSNTDANFTPDYAAAKQLDVSSFPVLSMTMSLNSLSTYKILVLGFKRTDYNVSDQNNISRTFSLGATTTPVTLSNFHLQVMAATVVPELFAATCICYNNGTLVGEYFKPFNLQDISLKGTLNRVVSGLSLKVTDIPGYVTSVSLTADHLVKAIQPIGATPTLWQTTGDGENRILATQSPSGGIVSFENLLLPTTSGYATKLYLDLKYGTLTERYTVNVSNVTGVSSSNNITFTKNQVVSITGSYNTINLGFVLTANINLEDDIWDGITF